MSLRLAGFRLHWDRCWLRELDKYSWSQEMQRRTDSSSRGSQCHQTKSRLCVCIPDGVCLCSRDSPGLCGAYLNLDTGKRGHCLTFWIDLASGREVNHYELSHRYASHRSIGVVQVKTASVCRCHELRHSNFFLHAALPTQQEVRLTATM